MWGAEVPEDLATLLGLWWSAERASALRQLGMPSECPSTRGYRSTAIWDTSDESDSSSDRMVREMIGRAVDALPQDQRSVAHLIAKNEALGLHVWSSARLPEALDARQALVAATCAALVHALRLDVVDEMRA